jgi:hypothetical protein
MKANDCEPRLSFDVPVTRRLFEPTHSFGAAGRDANTLEIAAPDAVLRFG